MKKIIIICLLAFSASSSYAQEEVHKKSKVGIPSNSVKILFTDFYSRATSYGRFPIPEPGCTQQGLYYERRVINNFFVGVGYMQWYNLLRDFSGKGTVVLILHPFDTPVVGSLRHRIDYKMLDGYIQRKIRIKQSPHVVGLSLGMSYCWGTDVYMVSEWYYSFEPHIVNEGRRADYYGIIPGISYDYQFWKNRLGVGGDIRARYYSGRPEAQYDYGIHIGVNF